MGRIVITGGNGFIASLVKEKLYGKYEIVSIDRDDLDLSNPQAVKEFFEKETYQYVFHTGAMAQTKDCEEKPEWTHRINVESTIEIAKACQKKDARLIFISTEQCFNGKTIEGPFAESDTLESVTHYGKHKIECEDFIDNNLTNYITLRFSWMFGMSKPGVRVSPNIIQNVMNAMFYHQPTKFTQNEIRGMTYAQKLADHFEEIMRLPSGIYHFSDVNTHNTYESAKIVASKLGYSEGEINQYILADTERYSDRFRDYRLQNDKLGNAGIELGTFEENVEQCLRDFGWLK